MKKYLNLATALLSSLKPKSQQLKIDSYGQTTLTYEQQQALMEWLFASLMNGGYFGKAYLIWDDGQDREREIITALIRNEPIFLYRLGERPSLPPAGFYWRLMGEHPGLRMYQLEMKVKTR